MQNISPSLRLPCGPVRIFLAAAVLLLVPPAFPAGAQDLEPEASEPEASEPEASEPAETGTAESRTSIRDRPRKTPLTRLGQTLELDVVTLDGETIKAEDLRGNVVLLDFWGTWCPPCIASLPQLKRFHEMSRDRPFRLVSISNDTDGDVLRSFIAKHEMTWPQVWDEDQELTGEIFRIDNYPTYVLVDPEGEIVYRQSGWGRGNERALDARVMFAIRAAER